MTWIRTTGMQVRLWMLSHLPFGLLARPAEWFLTVVCCFSGLTIVTGVATINPVNELLWKPVYYLWGGMLIMGSISMACGLSSIHRIEGSNDYRVGRIACYKFGLRLLGRGAFIYAVAVVAAAKLDGVFAASMALVFSGAMAVRLLTVGTIRMPTP